MTETTNRRHKKRIPTDMKTYYSFDRAEGVGVLADISYSGAVIEGKSKRPEIGTPIVLCVYMVSPRGFEKVSSFELAGHVVRHTSAGFAIKYKDNLDPDVRRMVDDAAAVVAAPR